MNGEDLNAAIAAMARRVADVTGSEVRIYDAHAAVSDMVRKPARYGFREVEVGCLEVPACAAEDYSAGLTIADTYINWDGFGHKTTRVHKLMADQIRQLLAR